MTIAVRITLEEDAGDCNTPAISIFQRTLRGELKLQQLSPMDIYGDISNGKPSVVVHVHENCEIVVREQTPRMVLRNGTLVKP